MQGTLSSSGLDRKIEEALAWARSLPPDTHKCDEVEVVRGGKKDAIRPIDMVCRICDHVRHTAMVQVWR